MKTLKKIDLSEAMILSETEEVIGFKDGYNQAIDVVNSLINNRTPISCEKCGKVFY